MEDIVTEVSDKVDVVVGAASAGAAWATSKFSWWKEQPKLVKAGVLIGVFLGVAVALSFLQALVG